MTKVMLRNDIPLKVKNIMGNHKIFEHDDEDFEPSKEFKGFEDENLKRMKKRKLSTNVSQENFHDEPSFANGNKKGRFQRQCQKRGIYLRAGLFANFAEKMLQLHG